MRIQSVLVHAFRNLAADDVALHDRLTVLTGDNGEGKTSFLEAIYFLAALRSFRAQKTSECIAFGAEAARIVGRVTRRDRSPTIEIRLQAATKRTLIDGKPLRSARDYRGDLNAVLFTPEDLALAKGSPELRRRFLDRGVYTASPAHLGDLLDHERALRSRNALLKSGVGTGPVAEAHAATLASIGARVIARRQRWLAAIRPRLLRAFAEVSGLEALPGILYAPSVSGIEERSSEAEIAAALAAAWERSVPQDLARGFTTGGAHADDLALSLGGRPLRIAGSQGQQRAFVLALKFAEIRHAEEAIGEVPVLLLDDVGSELDALRRGYLFDHLAGLDCQVIVTTTNISLLPITGERLVYRVHEGHLERAS